MVDKKSLDFLPKTFQTNSNRRFLNATMDQLIQEPNISRIYGFIGRQDLSPAFRSNDSYIAENDSYAQFYQLEPGLVINKRIANTDRFRKENAYNYVDLLNGIAAEGGVNTDHSRLFANEYYNYEGFIDLEKLVNYGKYYWMPNGPTTVNVNGGGNSLTGDFKVTRPLDLDANETKVVNRNIGAFGFSVDAFPNRINPIITLVRGGSYTFNVAQLNHPFYIQTEPGLGEGTAYQDNILKRQIFGVQNNGEDVGTVTFNVPTKDAQYFYENMPVVETIDLVLEIPFSKIQNVPLVQFFEEYDLDGIKNLSTTKLVVIKNDQDDFWYNPANYDDPAFPYSSSLYDRGTLVPLEQRRGIWQMSEVDGKIRLIYYADWEQNTRLFVKEGVNYGHLHVYKDSLLNIYPVPNITAPLDVLYYQDGIDENVYGEIRLVEPDPINTLDINNILGQPQYTSPNGVRFSSGLKIRFTGIVEPVEYANKEYVVEGVGKGIVLVAWDSLVTPDPNNPNVSDGFSADEETFDSTNYEFSLNAPVRKDYVVINRASKDGNAWSRTNRWFHEDVIRYSTTFADPFAPVVLDNNYRAIRPIIEFDSNLQLFNHGDKFAGDVMVIDNYVTDVANQVEGRNPYVLVYANQGASITKSLQQDVAVDSVTITLNSVSDIAVDMRVTGPNIPLYTVVESIDVANKTVTLNNALIADTNAGSEIIFNGTFFSDGVPLLEGTRVVFLKEQYANVRNKIYLVKNIVPHSDLPINRQITAYAPERTNILRFDSVNEFYINMKVTGENIPLNTVIMEIDYETRSVTLNNNLTTSLPVGLVVSLASDLPQIHLVPDHTMVDGENIVAMSGASRQNAMYYWKNNTWKEAQQKFSLHQSPLFDVFDITGISFGNTEYYAASTFTGSKLFGYKEAASGTRDPELGIVLTYKNIGNIGDIVFENYYDTDVFNFSYLNKSNEVKIGTGYVHENDLLTNNYLLRNNWTKVADLSKQYIQKSFEATDNKVNNWPINVKFINSFNEKNIFVYVNGKEIHRDEFTLLEYQDLGTSELVFNTDLSVGDRLVVKIFGNPQTNKENFTVPKNLVDNSENKNFNSLTLGQLRNHLQEIAANSLEFIGEPSGANNFRDINYKIVPGKILQHSAGAHVAQLMFNNESTSIIKALDFSRRSYSRFKDRFLYLLSTIEFQDTSNIRECLDTIMEEITVNSSSDQAFYYTDMLPFGQNSFIRNDYVVYDTNYRNFNLITSYDINEPTYRAVLVYLNNQQLLINRDYTVDGFVVRLSEDLTLAIDDVVSIYEYDSTKGCMIPATPTKLGLYPKFVPEVYVDDTYIEPIINVIQGHDGSKTVAFNDYRDDILLEFEKRVYNNINVEYFNDPNISFSSIEPGAFRQTDYSADEWTQLLSISFLSWAGLNNVNIFANETLQNDPFSFNYGQGRDKLFGEGLPGYWRGIYKYFYDTDRPHTHPWEMLGFVQKPYWWEVRYGPAPYTAGNLVLWKDLELGLVYQEGDNSYIDTRYARPGLLNVIPVDVHGTLKPPVSVIVSNWNQQTAGATWRFGDQSPQETAWRRSSDYPFAVQIAWALARPAQYCALSLNRRDIVRIAGLDQIINKKTANRQVNLIITDETQYVPGSNIWIRDRLADLSLDITENFKEIFENYSINLIYKLSGYTDKSYIQVIADQASPNSTNTGILIPQENYDILATKSAPVGAATYSAVIVEKSSEGFAVYGFDYNRPYFTIIPRRYNNNFYNIKVSNSTAVIYNDNENSIQTIPYGTQLANRQQVVDFLISYGKYLTNLGFEFVDVTSTDTVPTVADWTLAVKEFLFWTEQGWDNNTVISLSPAGTKINFNGQFGVVDELTNSFNADRIIDTDGQILQAKGYTTYRTGTEFELILKDKTKGVHLVDLNVVQYEHTIVFDNTTVFNDVIYEPSLGNRQYRLKISGFKTRGWDGSLYAPGFLINHKPIDQWLPMKDYYKGDIVVYKNYYYTAKKFIPGQNTFDLLDWYEINSDNVEKKLIPNLAFNAQQFENFYDVDQFDVNRTADGISRNVTGFTRRNYLTNMGLDDISQHKFYLGMIREKGTQSAINAFLRAKMPYLNSDVTINEQWAIRLGSYGGFGSKDEIELSLQDAVVTNGAYIVELLNSNDSKNAIWNQYKPNDLLIKPAVYNKDIFAASEYRDNTVPMAGPVLITDVDTTAFDIQNIQSLNGLVRILGEGNRIWVAADRANNYNVYRITADRNINVIGATTIGEEIEFFTDVPHQLTRNDTVMLKNATLLGASGNLSGFWRVSRVSDKSFRVTVPNNTPTGSGSLNARLFKLKSVKYASKAQFALNGPGRGWRAGDRVWIDMSTDYTVLENQANWTESQSLTPNFAIDADNFGMSVDIKATQDLMVTGAPFKDGSGKVFVYRSNDDNTWGAIEGLTPNDSYAAEFGYSVKCNNLEKVIVGAPGSNSNEGLAYIINATSSEIAIGQILRVDTISPNDLFGRSVASSLDGNWIAIGAPGGNTVYVYYWKEVDTATRTVVTAGVASHNIPDDALGLGLDAGDVKVRLNGKLLTPFLDYTCDGTAITLSVVPGLVDELVITYESYYKFISSFTNDEVDGGFGSSISFAQNGTQIAVGAPTLDGVINPNAGAAYVYERTVETFIASGSTNTFALDQFGVAIGAPNNPIVYVNGLLTDAYTIVGTDLILDTVPSQNSIITIESNHFVLVEKKQIDVENLGFGSKVAICPTTCSLYVGAPGYNNRSINNGAVYRYANSGRLYGEVYGKVINPSLTVGDAVRLNGVRVAFTGTKLADIVDDINNANIPGVSASITDNNSIKIVSDSAIAFNKLILGNSNGTAFADLGITVFDQYQIITASSDQDTTNFGSTLDVDTTGNKLIIGATLATNKTFTTFDSGKTYFDSETSKFADFYYRSGAAYLYEYQGDSGETANTHGNFTLAQNITTNSLQTNDRFGTAVALTNNWLMVTALHSAYNAGTIYSYYNASGDNNWYTVRTKSDDVDTRKVERVYLYNDYTKKLLATLPIVDPEHGMPVKSAAEQIRYTTNYDPAIYTNVPNTFSFSSNPSKSWGAEHVGELWWDTNSIKYVDWNQGDVLSRFQNWGLAFPASYINVYEWVESDTVPSEYARLYPASGPLYTVSDVFSTKTFIDPQTLQIRTKYYFWVRNSNSNNSMQRRDTALALQNLIANPRSNLEPFAAIIGTNTLALFNCQNLVDKDTRLHISVRDSVDVNPIHTEWSMFDDGSDLGVATEFLQRLNDSFAGQDAQGRLVPDQNLTEKERYGLGIRPRQTTFIDRFSARKLWVENINQVFTKYPMVFLRDINQLLAKDPEPLVDLTTIKLRVNFDSELDYINKNFYDIGDQILVGLDSTTQGWSVRELAVDPADSNQLIWQTKRVQTYDLSKYWSYTDWYATGFSADTAITKIVDFEYEIANINAQIGDVVKVKNSTDGTWKLVLVQSNSLELIGQQNATIQLNSSLWDNAVEGFGLDYQSFEISAFSNDAALEFRQIFDIVNNELLSKELRDEYKNVLKSVIDNISTQFKQNDWLFKTSLIDIKNRVRSLDQIPVYVKQLDDVITDFINEVKPYHTKINKFTSSYDKIDLAGLDVVDFDLPAYYNPDINKYRSPQLGNIIDDAYIGNKIYEPWFFNHTYGIEYIDIDHAGEGYNSDTRIVINGDGTGAAAQAFIRGGRIIDIQVTNPGYGYTYATILVVGTGSGATAFAKLGRGTARTINTTLTFDRKTYVSTVKQWQPNTAYTFNDVIVYNNVAYRLINNLYSFTTGSTFNSENLVELLIRRWEPNKSYSKDTIIVYESNTYVALEDFVSDRYFLNQAITIFDSGTTSFDNGGTSFNIDYTDSPIKAYAGAYIGNAADRVAAHYNPTVGMPGKDLAQVMTGIEYPGVRVTGADFDQAPAFDFGLYEQIAYDTRTVDENNLIEIYGDQALDTNLYSLYTDAQLGIRPEDMIVDGAAYIDANSSHAPEELIPGHMFDSLAIKVKTLNTSVIYQSPEIVLLSSYSDDVNTSFSFDPMKVGAQLPLGGIEDIQVYHDILGIQIEGIHYSVDWTEYNINFFNPPPDGGSVIIRLIGASGVNIIDDSQFIGDGIRRDFQIPDATLNDIQQVYVNINGNKNNNWSLLRRPSNATVWAPNTTFVANSLMLYNRTTYRVLATFTSSTQFVQDQNLQIVETDWAPLGYFEKDSYVVYNNFSYRVLETFIAGPTFNTEKLVSSNDVYIRFDNAPIAGEKINIHLYNLPETTKAYSDVVNQTVLVPNGFVMPTSGYAITLSNPLAFNEPWESNAVVYVNGNALEPSNQAYYTANGIETRFSLPVYRNIANTALINDSDIVVIIDGVTKTNFVDYTIDRTTSPMPTVVMTSAPARNSVVVISNRYTSQYLIYDPNTLIIKPTVTLNVGDAITVKTYSRHDQLDTRVEVFSGSVTTTSSVDLGLDIIGFDLLGFDDENSNIIVTPNYIFNRPVNNINNVIVTLNGIWLTPYYDYNFITPTNLRIDPAFGITSDDTIVVTHIAEETRKTDLEFKMFKGITETYDYLGISVNTRSRLVQDLAQDDEWIYVEDADVFSTPDPANARPGVVFINGERITFYALDNVNHRLGQLRRATQGTGAPLLHKTDSVVYDAGYRVEIPSTRDTYIVAEEDTVVIGKKGDQQTVAQGDLIRQGTLWLDRGTNTAANGQGLVTAETVQAKFLRAL